ncbi:zinc-binding dehydrogenase [Nocardia sp. NPDC004604]|uniref:zinc-binding dehydrogenase n=1 Tax=Nocardia sp. NPDC004604 TaxID=3157013 RepID=UPI0033AEDDD9
MSTSNWWVENTGGSGSVALYAIQMAKKAGALVIATAGRLDNQDAAMAAGADLVLDDRRDDTLDRILELAPLGADRIVDAAFGTNLLVTSRVVAQGGAITGYASGARAGAGQLDFSRRGAKV